MNEDALVTLSSQMLSSEKTLQFGLYGIADGMGGHEHGETASRIAIEQFTSIILELLFIPLLLPGDSQPDLSLQEVMQSAVLKAHEMIKKEVPGGGTTLTAVLLLGDQLTVTHVGDSRAYLANRDGKLVQLTHDHSVVKRLEVIGQISAEEAATHPQRNFLYQALGRSDTLVPDIQTLHLEPGSQVMLCSDGLWGVISEQQMLETILSASSPQQACHSLAEMANRAGGPDNISVIIVKIMGE